MGFRNRISIGCSLFEVLTNGVHCMCSEGNQPSFPTFSLDGNELPFEIYIAEGESDAFSNTETAAIEEFENGLFGGVANGGVLLRGFEYLEHFGGCGHSGKSLFGTRGEQSEGWVDLHSAGFGAPCKIVAKRRSFTSDGSTGISTCGEECEISACETDRDLGRFIYIELLEPLPCMFQVCAVGTACIW